MKKQVLKLKCTFGIVFSVLLINLTGSYAQKVSPLTDTKTLSHKTNFKIELDTEKYTGTKVYKQGTAIVTEIINQYLFPSDLDNNGETVVIQPFGNSSESYLWTKDGGITTFEGQGTSLSTNGTISGSYSNTNIPGGLTAETAGYYDIASQEWTFLGMNPQYPDVLSENYNDAWGQSLDGSTIVGMQWHDGWSVTAFKWSESEGYVNIGDSLDFDSRASGISRNGELVFGWNTTEMGFWSPVIWKNGTHMLLNPGSDGEVMCASADGNIVAGKSDGGAFYWTENEGLVPFGTDMDYPTIVMEDGSIFGFNGVFPPTIRQAFYRDTLGNITSFNDYAESRGMEDAQSWTFYSVNNVSMDGNKFIGAGVNTSGQDVCFLIEFTDVPTTYILNLTSSPVEGGVVNGAGEYEAGNTVNIEAIPNEFYNFVNWTNFNGDTISEEAATTITMLNNDLDLIANFVSTIHVNEIGTNNVSVYPNPADNIINIDKLQENSIIYLYTLMGEKIIEHRNFNNKLLKLNTSEIGAGIYILKIQSVNGSICKKIQIVK